MNKPRSPSVDRICDAAVIHFADKGYDAASLADIAEAVGIRKASLYTHFDSKDALFMQAIEDALELETAYVDRLPDGTKKGVSLAYGYCGKLRARFKESAHLKLILRSAYMPPAALHAEISTRYESYLENLATRFMNGLSNIAPRPFKAAESNVLREAYLGIVDGLHVELLYAGGDNFAARLKAFDALLLAYLSGITAD